MRLTAETAAYAAYTKYRDSHPDASLLEFYGAGLAEGRREQRAADTKDAERYRFLRDGEYPETLLEILVVEGVHRHQVDTAIDAAIESQCDV